MKLPNSILLLLTALLLQGCLTATIRPIAARIEQPSYDGEAQDSGIIELTARGAVVTQHFHDRYNALIALYGQEPDFVPPLLPDQEIAPAPPATQTLHTSRGPTWVISQQGLVHFLKMNRWKKMGRVPANAVPKPGLLQRVGSALLP